MNLFDKRKTAFILTTFIVRGTNMGVNGFKSFLFKTSLNRKLVAMMLLLNISLIVILMGLYYSTEKSLYIELENQIRELSKSIQLGIEEVTKDGKSDDKVLNDYLKKLNTNGINEISIISNSNKIISSTNPDKAGKWISRSKKELIFKANLGEPVAGEENAYNVTVPVVAGNTHYGYIHLTINVDSFSSMIWRKTVQRVIAVIAVFLVGTIAATLLAQKYTKPIKKVVEAARRVAGGDLELILESDRQDEIGELTRSFNFMLAKLKVAKNLEERLRAAENYAAIIQFSRSIAHEIRNPLNFISLSIDHMKEVYPPPSDDHDRYNSLIRNIKQEIQRVSKFTESFLESGKPLELNKQKTDFKILIEDVLEIVRAKAENDKILIHKELNFLPELYVDSDFIKTCLYNIVINAFNAMADGGSLTLKSWQMDDKFRIAIEDTGVGIPEENMSRIFDPFFTTKNYGLGLGLALTKKIIEEHGGRIEIKRNPERGISVVLYLPLKEMS
ncbi:HAMP domain-containing protein [bacterium]|nr:HAMP domain-containing protein [bacterium]